MKHLIVLNPGAGKKEEKENIEEKIKQDFEGLDYEIYYTTGPRAVIPYLKDYLAKQTDEVRVYACGGDGTVHEVVNGLVGFNNAELAIYAIGTGNDFVKVCGGREKFLDFKTLINGKVEEIDLSKISGNTMDEPWYSINVINYGFDAIVGAKGNENKLKGKANPYGFTQAIVPAILHGRFNKIIVKADGEQLNEKKLLLSSVSQGQWVGGEYHASPKSNNKDGLMDVVLMKPMSFIVLMSKYFSAYHDGKHLDDFKKYNKVVYKQAKKVEIDAPKDVDICVDGEIVRGTHFDIEVMPKAIKLVIPE